MTDPLYDATLICFVRMPSDTRDTASSTVSAMCPQRLAMPIARDIEYHAGAFQRAVDRGDLIVRPPGFANSAGRVVPGHGTTVVYASGWKRTVRSDD